MRRYNQRAPFPWSIETALLFLVSLGSSWIDAFVLPPSHSSFSKWQQSNNRGLSSSSKETLDSAQIQWDLFQKHHIGNFKGIWTTYDYMGDVKLETMASVDSQFLDDNNTTIGVVHNIVQGSVQSDCDTCFDSANVKTIPVAQYTKDNLQQYKVRLGANGMVVGPSLLKSGAMATECVLRYGDARVRVILQHAPVWSQNQGVGPPDGLKVVRVLVSKETVRDQPPTPASEVELSHNQPQQQHETNILFTKPTPPFAWHKQWAGTSWTWGVDSGDRGWSMELDANSDDAWHGSAPVELWNLRQNTVFVQSPRILTNLGVLRVAWLASPSTMLRLEAGVQVLQPLVEDDEVIGFAPPTLATFRCDVLKNVGELEGQPTFVEQSQALESGPVATAAKPLQVREDDSDKTDGKDDSKDSGLDAIRNALQL